MITLEKTRDALRDWKFEVEVDLDIAERARGSIHRMVQLG
jgi:quinolinate synthase